MMIRRATGFALWATFSVVLTVTPPLPAHRQFASGTVCPVLPVFDAEEGEAAVKTTVTPAEVQEVVAEGRAALGVGGVLGARRAAEAQALRNAVEKALGVYVSARSLTQNYVLVRDQILTRSDGYATLKEVIKEKIGTEEVRVTVRALVSLKPLAQQLKALKLTRAYRVYVQNDVPRQSDRAKRRDADSVAGTEMLAGLTSLQNRLADAGFVVVDAEKDADMLIRVRPRFTTTQETPLDTAVGAMTLYSIDGVVSVQALRAGTGEVVAAFSASDTAAHINRTTARSETAERILTRVSPHLIDALMVLPAAQSQPVTLIVSKLRGIKQAGLLEDALERLIGVEKVTRRSYTAGTAVWELDVLTDAAPRLSRELEESSALEPFRLNVLSENRAKISASVLPAMSRRQTAAD